MIDHLEYIKTIEKIYSPTLIPSRCEEDKCKGCEWFKYKTETYCVRPRLEECKRGLSMSPSRPTGHWIKHTGWDGDKYGTEYTCDKCGEVVGDKCGERYNFCPYCGDPKMIEP